MFFPFENRNKENKEAILKKISRDMVYTEINFFLE